MIHKIEVRFDGVESDLDIIRSKLQRQKNLKIGRKGCIVEMDETKLTERKGNVGRVPETVWCDGGVCRVYKKFFYELVKNRSAFILTDILKRNVKTNSTIIQSFP
ncbi:hypothetical protein CDIK_4425 [Cucumispora dikerogammari]|nr:hypothetical protein CDIK_4425 [Cucumispora dikerogammari]